MKKSIKFSITIIGHNELGHLQELLPSLQWADEVIYVDCSSTDDSFLFAKEIGCKVFQRPNDPNLNINKAYAIDHASGDWIFYLDPDERITPSLAREIREKIAHPDSAVAYTLKRKNHYFGRWLKHGSQYPDFQLRLFQKDQAAFPKEHVHERLQVNGAIGILKEDLLHFPYLSISQFLQKFDFYTTFEANYLWLKGVKPNFSNTFQYFFFKPITRFIRRYFFKLGIKDGWPGLFAVLFDSLNFMVRYFKLLEISKDKGEIIE
jgi:glycosyltransferase involved in cell wall biosynthesis